MPVVKLTLEYQGTRYVGWQLQPNGRLFHASVASGAMSHPSRVSVFNEDRTVIDDWMSCRENAHKMGVLVH